MLVHPDFLDTAIANDYKAIDIIVDWGYGGAPIAEATLHQAYGSLTPN